MLWHGELRLAPNNGFFKHDIHSKTGHPVDTHPRLWCLRAFFSFLIKQPKMSGGTWRDTESLLLLLQWTPRLKKALSYSQKRL